MKYRLLLFGHSQLTQTLISALLKNDPRVISIDAKRNIEAFKRSASLGYDVILLDPEENKESSTDLIKWVMQQHPTPVVIFSIHREDDPESVREYLKAGAVSVLPKPLLLGEYRNKVYGEAFVEQILFYAHTRKLAHTLNSNPATGLISHLIVLGASTGGPVSLKRLLLHLSQPFSGVIFVVQHIPAPFFHSFVYQISQNSKLPVSILYSNQKLESGNVYVIPTGFEVSLIKTEKGYEARLFQSDAVPYCPSISHTMSQAAIAAKDKAVGVVLDGLGDDGVSGLGDILIQGGQTMAEDPKDALIPGIINRSAARGFVQQFGAPEEIASKLQEVCKCN